MAAHTREATQTGMQEEVTVRQPAAGNGSDIGASLRPDKVAADLRAMIDARLRSAYDQFMATPHEEIAEPLDWWDLYAVGPIQPGASMTPPSFTGPLQPNQVIRVGEQAYIITVLLLSTTYPSSGLSAADLLSKFALPYEIDYDTGDLKKWVLAPANLQHVSSGNLVPGVPWAIDVFGFTAQDEGVYEMNICARIYGCGKTTAPPFAGYATQVVDIDTDMFGLGPRLKTEQSIRFHCYK
jgi:hypothetical protein